MIEVGGIRARTRRDFVTDELRSDDPGHALRKTARRQVRNGAPVNRVRGRSWPGSCGRPCGVLRAELNFQPWFSRMATNSISG